MFEINIIKNKISCEDLNKIAGQNYGDMVKAAVDISREIIAIGGEWHADAEKILLEDGSNQADIWGINLYPNKSGTELIEYSSLINIRPRAGNRGQDIESIEIKEKIFQIINKFIEQ